MSDDVTLEDLQKVYKRLEALEAGLKETNRLLKIQDEFGSDLNKMIADNAKTLGGQIDKLDTRVSQIEKKLPKK